MASLLNPTLTTREIIKMASSELDSKQIEIVARLSPTACLELMFEMCEFIRQLAFSVERQENPSLSDAEINARISQQLLLSHG